jgi:hypothetical protein
MSLKPMTPPEALAALRSALPPGATVYTLQLTPQDDQSGTSVVAVFSRRRLGDDLRFQNVSWHAARINAFPLADDSHVTALNVTSVGFPGVSLVERLEEAIWLDPRVKLATTRLQRWKVRRAVSRMYPSSLSGSVRMGGLFKHEPL